MEKEPAKPERAHDLEASANEQIADAIAQAQHDLRNPLGHILCFCEILIPQAQQSQDESLTQGLKSIDATAAQMVKDINRVLDPNSSPSSQDEVGRLQAQLREQTSQILHIIPSLVARAAALKDDLFTTDLTRMSDSARRLGSLVETALSFYSGRNN